MFEQTSTGYFQNQYKFNGKELDQETGLYYYGARYYDPKVSLWLSVFYTGNLAECKNVLRIPTGQIQQDVQHTVSSTIKSGLSPETRVENGGHSLVGDKSARIWDEGTAVQTQTLPDGRIERRWSVKPFLIGGKSNRIGGAVSDIEFFWHSHPNGSVPSRKDIRWVGELRRHGFTGNSFLIDVNNDRVIFFDEEGVLISIKYEDFKRMGNQEQIK